MGGGQVGGADGRGLMGGADGRGQMGGGGLCTLVYKCFHLLIVHSWSMMFRTTMQTSS